MQRSMRLRLSSVPFSITILSLMAVIVVPLAAVLIWLGARTAGTLEQRAMGQRMVALETGLETFITTGLRLIVSVGATLAEGPSFQVAAGKAVDGERLQQLGALLDRHPTVAAVYIGYADGHFLYAGRTSSLAPEQRARFGAPPGDSIILRTIDGVGASRRETWWFRLPDGARTAERNQPIDYDPRVRPWYVEAVGKRQPILTEPYVFAQAGVIGISAGVPLKGDAGAFGFDLTLDTLSNLVAEYKITPGSIVMVASTAGVFIESKACSGVDCRPGEAEARKALATTIMAPSDGAIQRQVGKGDRAYELIVESMRPMLGRQFAVGAAVPVSELAADSLQLMHDAIVASAIAVAIAILAVLGGSLLLSRPLLRLAAKTESIRQLDFSDNAAVRSRVQEISQLSDSVERMRDALEIFGRYVSRPLVRQIMRSPESAGLGGTRRDITVMFTDIESFSRLSEGVEPEVLTGRLSRYFDALGMAIAANNGVIDKYIGDCIMAYWNAPEFDPEHVAHACRSALQAASASRRLADKWRSRDRPVFRTRFGLHTGPAIVGNVGARDRINYTLVGTVANQASRLEGLNKAYGTEILASGDVMDQTREVFVWRRIDRVVAAGTTEAHDIHELMGEAGETSAYASFLKIWNEAQAAYDAGRFSAAIEGYEAALVLRPDDGPCRVFISRCAAFLLEGTPADWDGAWRFDTK